MVANIEADIWDRVLTPEGDRLSPEAARALLQIGFKQADIDRMNALAEHAREGTLSQEARAEMESYNRIGHMLAIIHSKARRALQD